MPRSARATGRPGTAAFHIGADIADAAIRYVTVRRREFERAHGFELIVETARMWRSLGHHDASGGFRIDGVTGPDEYSAIADNNVYTNLMAEQNLRRPPTPFERIPVVRRRSASTRRRWPPARRRSGRCRSRSTRSLGVHQQAEQFTEHARWDFDGDAGRHVPAAPALPLLRPLPKPVVKQAHLVLAMHRGATPSATRRRRATSPTTRR